MQPLGPFTDVQNPWLPIHNVGSSDGAQNNQGVKLKYFLSGWMEGYGRPRNRGWMRRWRWLN